MRNLAAEIQGPQKISRGGNPSLEESNPIAPAAWSLPGVLTPWPGAARCDPHRSGGLRGRRRLRLQRNGHQCEAGICRCEAPWSGPECQRLELAPAAPGLAESLTSTWGGSTLHGDDGRLYMYAVEMVGHCGIQAWTRNSRVIVASADNASAPFKFEKELFGVLSHEPVATRAPTGEFVIFFTTTTLGCGSYSACVPNKTCAHVMGMDGQLVNLQPRRADVLDRVYREGTANCNRNSIFSVNFPSKMQK